MRIFFTVICSLLASYTCYAQQSIASNWYFGRNAGISFSTGAPVALTDGQLNTNEGCSSISDDDGNLLFYTDGITVYDRNHNVMNYANGDPADNLLGNPSSTQSGMIVPQPESDDIYYLFTVDHMGGGLGGGGATNGLNLYTVDMSANNGNGEITEGPVSLSDGRQADWSEKVTAVEGAGDRCGEIWVLSAVENDIYAYSVSENGVNLTPVITTVQANFTLEKRGYMKLSPNGRRMAAAIGLDIYLYDFDGETGQISNEIQIEQPGNSFFGIMYGVEFSSNSNKLYTTNSGENIVYQYNLASNDIEQSREEIIDLEGARGGLQLGPDGRIYSTYSLQVNIDSPNDPTFLGVIENPNANADDVIFTLEGVMLGGQRAAEGLPPFISSMIIPDPPAVILDVANDNEDVTGQVINVCEGESRTLRSDEVDDDDVIYRWIEVDDADNEIGPVLSEERELEFNDITLDDEGRYKLEVSILGCATRSAEGIFSLVIVPEPVANDASLEDCYDPNKTYNLPELFDEEVLGDQDPDLLEVVYFETEEDARNNENPIDDPENYSIGENQDSIWARVQYDDISCFDIVEIPFDLIRIDVNVEPTPYSVLDQDGTADGITDVFILSTKDDEILDGADPTTHTITYHETEEDAENGVNPIDKDANYTNEIAYEDQVWVRVVSDESAAAGCYLVFPLDLLVTVCPTAPDLDPVIYCDDDGDGEYTINLEDEFTALVLDGQLGDLEVLYFNTQDDADNNVNPIPLEFVITGDVTLFARIHTVLDPDNNDCADTTEITLGITVIDVNDNLEDYQQEDLDGTVDGFTNTFDLASQDAQILNGADAALYEITYYRTQQGAENADAADLIDKTVVYTNEQVNRQTVYVRVEAAGNSDCSTILTLDLVVVSCPVANEPDDLSECASGAGLTYEFEFRTEVTPIVLGNQSTDVFLVRYYGSQQDAEADTNRLAEPYTNTDTTETIWARVFEIADSGSCDPAITSFEISVLGISVPEELENITGCDDQGDGILTNIDLTQRTVDVLANYDVSEHGNFRVSYHSGEFRNGSDLISNPENFSNTEPYEQRIYVLVEDAATGECPNESLWFDIVINPLPEFDVTDQGICEGVDQIILTPENPADTYTYEWRRDEDTTVIGTEMELTVAEAGTYHVTATDPDTGCIETKTINVQRYVIQTITLQDVRVIDGAHFNTIFIDNFNTDFEFSLLDEGGVVVREFQDEPVFENVTYGFYTVVVRDKGGCGTSSIEVIVLDVPRFFTPNNDGNNDRWQIKELDFNFFTDSKIYIYDRYGRLLKEISRNLQGWDGTFRDKPLPATDYWYTVELVDIYGRMRTIKGHFSLVR